MNEEMAKTFINSRKPDFLRKAKTSGYICPKCNNGTGSSGTGITKDNKGKYKCFNFKCGIYEDIIGLYKIENNISNYNQAIKDCAEYFGIKIERDATTSSNKTETKKTTAKVDPVKPIEEKKQVEEKNFIEEYKKYSADLGKVSSYLEGRGITLETARRFNLGFCEKWKMPLETYLRNGENRTREGWEKIPFSPRLIIPVTENTYTARDTRKELTEKQEGYKKQKVKANDKANWIFNSKALYEATKPIFIVEGELDAISIIQEGGEAVATGSTSYIKQLINLIEGKPPVQPLILCLDNDKAGIPAQEKLKKRLDQLGIKNIVYSLEGGKDANEILVKDAEELIRQIKDAEELALNPDKEKEDKREEYKDKYRASNFESTFYNLVNERSKREKISTGYSLLDEILYGGLEDRLYIIGGGTSVGKTAFAMQMADYIATTFNGKAGKDILYISLEMAKEELIARSISRYTYMLSKGKKEKAKNTNQVLYGIAYSERNKEKAEIVNNASNMYFYNTAKNMYIIEGVGSIGVQDIEKYINDHISITGTTPVVIVDYLQILKAPAVKNTDKQNIDYNVVELKRLSRDYRTPIILLSSFNRQSYGEKASEKNYNGSGSIEYSADVLLSLQYKAVDNANAKNPLNEDAEKAKEVRKLSLKIVKNRNGASGIKIAIDYCSAFNYMQNKKYEKIENVDISETPFYEAITQKE